MNRHKLGLIPATLGLLFGLSLAAGAQPLVEVIRIDGIINPISSKFIVESIQRAEEDKAECLVIQMDTPGGLMESMRSVVKEMLSAEVPVVVYVWPSGARAASAGVFITLAAHIAAMTPGTNIGAAHPVSLGSAQDSTGAKTMMDNIRGIKVNMAAMFLIALSWSLEMKAMMIAPSTGRNSIAVR